MEIGHHLTYYSEQIGLEVNQKISLKLRELISYIKLPDSLMKKGK